MKVLSLLPLAAIALALSVTSAGAGSLDPDADYDRLDGKGKSGKKVDVIEWEGNLEIHVYPQGGLAGLALKLDKRNKDKPVMVIGYRFSGDPKTQHIRRAILGIPFQEGFKVFKDPTADGYDKIVISNNGLPKPLVAFNLDPELKQLYPDGHPALAAGQSEERKPASRAGQEPASSGSGQGPASEPAQRRSIDEETGTILPFLMHKEPR